MGRSQLGSLVWWVFSVWVSSIVVVSGRGVSGQSRTLNGAEMNPLDLSLPEACGTVAQGEKLVGSSNQDTKLEEQLPWLKFSGGVSFHEMISEPGMEVVPPLSVQFSSTATLSRSAYNYVYIVQGVLSFVARHNVPMEIQVQGVLSVNSRELCARGCTTEGPTPAWFLYFSGITQSIPDASAMVVPEHDCGILVRIHYPKEKTISMVHVEVTSSRAAEDSLYFSPIDIAAVYQGEYESPPQAKEAGTGDVVEVQGNNGKYSSDHMYQHSFVCKSLAHSLLLPIVWNSSCGSGGGTDDCTPFKTHNYGGSRQPTHMRVQRLHCSSSDWKVTGHFVFEDHYGGQVVGDATDLVLTAEGVWDFGKRRLVMLACQSDNVGTASDCRIQITLEFSNVFRRINHPTGIFGRIHSSREDSDPLFFRPFSFFGGGWNSVISSHPTFQRIIQEFGHSPIDATELIEPFCKEKESNANNGGERNWAKYPEGSEFSNLDLQNLLTYLPTNAEFSPNLTVTLSVTDIGLSHRSKFPGFRRGFSENSHAESGKKVNVSFDVNVSRINDIFVESKDLWFKRIAAEGWYNPETGHLCMVGCRTKIWSVYGDNEDSTGIDCSMVINMQYPETNPSLFWGETPHATGNITSLRSKTDLLYFHPIELDSCSRPLGLRAREALWRKRIDAIISVATLCLLVVIMSLQQCDGKKYNRKLPFYTLLMLGTLAASRGISLILNLDTVFLKFGQGWFQDSLFSSNPPLGGKVLFRFVSMAALLMELRWFQLVWIVSRVPAAGWSMVDISKAASSRAAEYHVLYICLPIFGLAFTVYELSFLAGQQVPAFKHSIDRKNYGGMQHLMWANLQASAEGISYFFLFPHVVSRVLWGFKNEIPKSLYVYMVLNLISCLAQFYDRS